MKEQMPRVGLGVAEGVAEATKEFARAVIPDEFKSQQERPQPRIVYRDVGVRLSEVRTGERMRACLR